MKGTGLSTSTWEHTNILVLILTWIHPPYAVYKPYGRKWTADLAVLPYIQNTQFKLDTAYPSSISRVKTELKVDPIPILEDWKSIHRVKRSTWYTTGDKTPM